jgi:Common central domain of tyrosinase/Bacterial Ig domain
MLSIACSSRLSLCGLFAAVLIHLSAAAPASAGADLFIKDTPLDTGSEPNPDTGPMWVSEDIWVRTTPDPGYQPYPFPEASPPWIPLPNESPEYRDPKFSVPNYVYVRVRNRGDAASTGTERLRVYWAKASTGLGWPTQWVDYLANNCGPTKLYGAELTKPRKNAATATAAERDAYRDAILKVGTLPGFVFPGGIRYWHKQDQVHQNAMSFFPSPHGGLAFTPWHREMINRYEILLQEADPTVKLLYWDWTKDPGSSTGFNFFTSAFMGASGRGTGGVSIGAPFLPALAPPAVSRRLGTSTTPPANPDTSILAAGDYPAFRSVIENVPNHNSSHTYIGGNMGSVNTATEDPFFFLLHANNDRLWAQWQRNPTQLARLDQAQTYGTAATIHADITTSMAPWNGTGPAIRPWTAADGYIVGKSARHPSVVFPPIYDTAPLTIPVLQPGEAVVIEIPWYPLNPADFACFGGDQGHACLLARVETAVASPFGMTTPEIASVNANTNANNNIAWKNVTVVDKFTGAFKTASVLVRNPTRERVQTTLQFATPEEFGASFLDFGQVQIDLGSLLPRWDEGGGQGRGIASIEGRFLLLTSPNGFLSNLRIEPGETFPVHVTFRLPRDYQPPRGVFPKLDVIQLGLPGDDQAVVGGQRFEMDFDRLALVPEGAEWRFFDRGRRPGAAWASPEFDDGTWKVGRPGLGFGGERPAPVTTYFRRRFEVGDQSFFRSLELRLKRDDGAAVYLNGVEVLRANLPGGALSPQTLATRKVEGLEEELVFALPLQGGLRNGTNVLAVEVHQAAGDTDLSFDLALTANDAFPGEPPGVAFAPGLDGRRFQAGQAIALPVEGLDSDGTVAAVSFFADGRLLGTVSQPPFRFVWRRAPGGPHRLRAVATDDDGQQSTAEASISVLANLPPTVQLTQPVSGSMAKAGVNLPVVAAAADPGGAVARVQFFLRQGMAFDAPTRLVGTVTRPPYRLVLRGLRPDHYMLTAVAVDAQGATGESSPVHFMVHP